jgi:hypothetical protein
MTNLAPIKAIIAEYVAKGWFDLAPSDGVIYLTWDSDGSRFWKTVNDSIGFWHGGTRELMQEYPELLQIPKLHRYLYGLEGE